MKIEIHSDSSVTVMAAGDSEHYFFCTIIGLKNCLNTLGGYLRGAEGNEPICNAIKSAMTEIESDLHALENAN